MSLPSPVAIESISTRGKSYGDIVYAYRRNHYETPRDAALFAVIDMRYDKVFQRIDHISSSKFTEYRNEISEGLNTYMMRVAGISVPRNGSQDGSAQSGGGGNGEHYEPILTNQDLIKQLLSSKTPEEKKQLFTQFKDTPYVKTLCTVCQEPSDGSKTGCIHHDCPGMCKGCHTHLSEQIAGQRDTSHVMCPCCSKAQVTTCPICTEDVGVNDCMRGRNCSHSVCFKCIADSIRAGRAIQTCPMCRVNFH